MQRLKLLLVELRVAHLLFAWLKAWVRCSVDPDGLNSRNAVVKAGAGVLTSDAVGFIRSQFCNKA